MILDDLKIHYKIVDKNTYEITDVDGEIIEEDKDFLFMHGNKYISVPKNSQFIEEIISAYNDGFDEFDEALNRYYYKKEYLPLEKLNKTPLKYYYTNPTKKEPRVYFVFRKKRYYFTDFIRVYDNPWTGKLYLPRFIHGYMPISYDFAYFMELCEDNEHVNLYCNQTSSK